MSGARPLARDAPPRELVNPDRRQSPLTCLRGEAHRTSETDHCGNAAMHLQSNAHQRRDEYRRYFPDWTDGSLQVQVGEVLEDDHNCLTLEFAARHAHRYAAAMAFTGGLIWPPGSQRNYTGDFAGTPVFIGSSDVDAHAPLERVQESTAVLTRLGARVNERIRFPIGPSGPLLRDARHRSRTRRFEVPGRSSSRSCGCQQRDGHFCQCDEVASLTETCWTS